MKWTMLVTVFFLLVIVPLSAHSAPYLVCAPATGVDDYRVSLDNGATWTVVPKDATGTHGFKLDLVALADGTYTAKAKACNMWGCSADSLPFGFSKATCGAPQGLMLLGE